MSLANALAGLGKGPLTEEALERHIYPLFSKSLTGSPIYLANHSLGRPPDQTEEDLCEGFRLWQSKLRDAWEWWLEEQQAHRSRLGQLIGARRPDCIIPKASAGQGLRTILNGLPGVPRVVSTTGEFDSIDVILKQYAALDKITLQQVPCESADGGLDLTLLIERIRRGVDLVVLSQVMFMTGRIVPQLNRLAERPSEPCSGPDNVLPCRAPFRQVLLEVNAFSGEPQEDRARGISAEQSWPRGPEILGQIDLQRLPTRLELPPHTPQNLGAEIRLQFGVARPGSPHERVRSERTPSRLGRRSSRRRVLRLRVEIDVAAISA
jgi:hypothetical protein